MQERREQVTAADIEWVRQQLSPQASQDCTDAQINRFVRAANFNREQVTVVKAPSGEALTDFAAYLLRALLQADLLWQCTQA